MLHSEIKRLYKLHSETLKKINKRKKSRHSKTKNHQVFRPQFDDIESEITSILILDSKPKKIIEFSPCMGWSTCILLDTLDMLEKDNRSVCSFDINDKCIKNVNEFKPKDVMWKFKLGDVREKFDKWKLSDIDFLFIDSDHSVEFTENYIANLLDPLLKFCKENAKEVYISVHDIWLENKNGDPLLSPEGKILLEFLKNNNISHYTAAKCKENYKSLVKLRNELGMIKQIHYGKLNPAVFFKLG